MTEESLSFVSNETTLYGILHRPDADRDRRVGVLLCVAGLTYHVGLSRLYVRLARNLSRLGYHVLRFDPHGVGDSDGMLSKRKIDDLFRDVELGEFVDDTLCAIDYFFETCGIDRLVLGGFCGGAVTSLLAAPHRLGKISGLVLAGPTALLHGGDSQDTAAQPITEESARQLRIQYVAKLFSPRAWMRLLSMKTDLRQLIISFLQPLLKFRKNASQKEILKKVPNFNVAFADAFFEAADKELPMLFAFGERAAERSEFNEIFFPFIKSAKKKYVSACDLEVIEKGDHNFVLPEAQGRILEVIEKWIERVLG